MHTAICTFDDRASAQQAVERLVEAGFDRSDVHLEFRHADGSPMGGVHKEGSRGQDANDQWDGLEREVAVDRGVLENFGHFFASLFGKDDPHGHAGTYSRAVERGHCVVVVDAHDDARAERAQAILHGMEAGDMSLVRRAEQRPLRDIVGARQASGMERHFGTARAEMGAAHDADLRREGEFPREREGERAMASSGSMATSTGWGEQRSLELREEPDDASHAPGLRYADKGDDKPR